MKHRNSLQKSLCPVVICPHLCSSDRNACPLGDCRRPAGHKHGRGGDGTSPRPGNCNSSLQTRPHRFIHSFTAPLTRGVGLRREHSAPISRRSVLQGRSSVQQGTKSERVRANSMHPPATQSDQKVCEGVLKLNPKITRGSMNALPQPVEPPASPEPGCPASLNRDSPFAFLLLSKRLSKTFITNPWGPVKWIT